MQDGDWDWDRPFDEDFVRGARAHEEAGAARAQRAARIAAQHRAGPSWRATLSPQMADPAEPPVGAAAKDRSSRGGLLAVLALIAAVAVLWGAGLLGAPERPAESLDGRPRQSSVGPDPAVISAGQSDRLLPLPAPLSGTGGYRFSALGGVPGSVRWDPCTPIRYVTRALGSPPEGGAMVAEAFDRLSAATGLMFVSRGQTSEGPSQDRAVRQPGRYGNRFAPVLVVWSDPRESPMLAGAVAGYAGPAVVGDGRGARLVTGQVVLDAPAFRSFRAPDEGLGVLLHELGHLVGLDHVADEGDIMNAESVQGAPITSYTPGALRGLRLLGAGQCFE